VQNSQRPVVKECARQVENVLELAVSRDEVLGFVIHSHAVAHILKGHAELVCASH
jgi:hypothetical protein